MPPLPAENVSVIVTTRCARIGIGSVKTRAIANSPACERGTRLDGSGSGREICGW
jgi:hypothetical protein